MIHLLSPIGAKVGFGLSAILLLAVIALKLSLAHEQRHSAKLRTALAEVTAAYDQFRADVSAKTEAARLADAANKARVEASQNTIKQEASNDYQALRTRYHDALGRLRTAEAGSDSGRCGNPAVPGAPGAADAAARAGSGAFVSQGDLNICADNTAAAKTWLEWWGRVRAVPR